MKHLARILTATALTIGANWPLFSEEVESPKNPQYENSETGDTIEAASVDEETTEFSAEKADSYLKDGALFWWAEHKCVTCPRMVPTA